MAPVERTDDGATAPEPARGRDGVYVPGIARYFKTTMFVEADGRCRATLPVRPDLADGHGALRLGAVAYAVDVATGICSGIAVVDRGLWIVTTDIHVEVVRPVVAGPLRVDARAVRAGATTVVCEFDLVDESDQSIVGGGTTTNRPFPFEDADDRLRFPRGVPIPHDDGSPISDEPMAGQLGIRSCLDNDTGDEGAVEVTIDDRLRNPWGILHGGVTGSLVDLAASAVAGGRRGVATTIRYLSPGRVGPVRAVPRVVAVGEAATLVSVEVRDTGREDALMAVGTVTLR